MKKTDILNKIIYIPKQFLNGNDSVYSLVKESGYFEIYNQIKESDIIDVLVKHLDCIDQWLSHSENNRSGSGWYFKQNDNGKYIVGYLPIEGNMKVTEYLDKIEACAAFVKQKIEEVRNA